MGLDYIREQTGKPWRKRWNGGLDRLKSPKVGGVDPQIGPVPSIGRSRNALTRSSISSHSRLTWLLPLMPMALTRSSTDRVEMPWM